jgi:hypothetical protein
MGGGIRRYILWFLMEFFEGEMVGSDRNLNFTLKSIDLED